MIGNALNLPPRWHQKPDTIDPPPLLRDIHGSDVRVYEGFNRGVKHFSGGPTSSTTELYTLNVVHKSSMQNIGT